MNPLAVVLLSVGVLVAPIYVALAVRDIIDRWHATTESMGNARDALVKLANTKGPPLCQGREAPRHVVTGHGTNAYGATGGPSSRPAA